MRLEARGVYKKKYYVHAKSSVVVSLFFLFGKINAYKGRRQKRKTLWFWMLRQHQLMLPLSCMHIIAYMRLHAYLNLSFIIILKVDTTNYILRENIKVKVVYGGLGERSALGQNFVLIIVLGSNGWICFRG